MKAIILYAFGGLLKSEVITVQEYPPYYYLLYRKNDLHVFDVGRDTFDLLRKAKFRPAKTFIVLPNGNTAQVYELEEM